MESTLTFTVGAPSKCLMTGGYLVLSPENTGMVLALDCYFWAKAEVKDAEQLTITVHCPQAGETKTEEDDTMVGKSIAFYRKVYGDLCKNVKLTLHGDAYFYSHRSSLQSYDYSTLKAFGDALDPNTPLDLS